MFLKASTKLKSYIKGDRSTDLSVGNQALYRLRQQEPLLCLKITRLVSEGDDIFKENLNIFKIFVNVI